MEPRTIQIDTIIRELEAEIAEAEQRYSEARSRLDYLRGQRDGVLLVYQRSQAPAIITEGEG